MAQTTLDALARAMTALDQALVAVHDARAMVAMVNAALVACTAETVAERVADNLKPAPFFITEGVAHGLVEPNAPAGIRTVAVPVAAEPLVDRPRRSEAPRLAKANDDVPEVSNSASEPGSGRAPATVKKPRRGKLPLTSEPARKSDVMHRQAKDRDARELEQPVDRLATIRDADQKLALPAQTGDFRAVIGAPTVKSALPIPPLPAFARRQRLQAAMMFLKRQCILVSPVDRSALVRRYRVSGKREAMYAEEVVAFAIERGFQAEEQASC